MTDPAECRARAMGCIKKANMAIDVRTQNTLFQMAKTWLQLAEYVEQGTRAPRRDETPANCPAVPRAALAT